MSCPSANKQMLNVLLLLGLTHVPCCFGMLNTHHHGSPSHENDSSVNNGQQPHGSSDSDGYEYGATLQPREEDGADDLRQQRARMAEYNNVDLTLEESQDPPEVELLPVDGVLDLYLLSVGREQSGCCQLLIMHMIR